MDLDIFFSIGYTQSINQHIACTIEDSLRKVRNKIYIGYTHIYNVQKKNKKKNADDKNFPLKLAGILFSVF